MNKGCMSKLSPRYLSIYLSHSLGDRWGTTRPGNQHSPFLSFLCSPHGVTQFQTRPFPDVIFPSFSLSASPFSSQYSAMEDCLGKSRSSCDMSVVGGSFSLGWLVWGRLMPGNQNVTPFFFSNFINTSLVEESQSEGKTGK